MARIRTVKPEMHDDERVASLSDAAFRIWMFAITQADDYGNTRGAVRWLSSRIWWRREPSSDAAEALAELTATGLVRLYEVNGEPFMALASWGKHQRIDNAGKPAVPPPSASAREVSPRTAANRREPPRDHEGSPREAEGSPLDLEGKGVEGNGSEGSGTRASRDTATHPVARTIGVGNPLAEVKRQLGEVRAECTGGVLVDADWRKLMPLVQELHAKGKAHESIAAFRAFHADTFWQSRGHPVQAFVKGYSEHDAKAKSAGRPRITSNGDGAQEVRFD